MPNTLRQSYANYFDGLNAPNVQKTVNVVCTSTTLVNIWTPASGRKFRILAVYLQCQVSTVLVAGATIALLDNVATAPLLGIASFATTAALATSATFNQVFQYPGIPSSTADNVLKMAGITSTVSGTSAAADLTTGKVFVTGQIFGIEE